MATQIAFQASPLAFQGGAFQIQAVPDELFTWEAFDGSPWDIEAGDMSPLDISSEDVTPLGVVSSVQSRQ